MSKGSFVESNTKFDSLKIGESAEIGKNCILRGRVRLGRYSRISDRCEFRGNSLEIGKFTNISREVLFQGFSHDYSKASLVTSTVYDDILNSDLEGNTVSDIKIGNDVWIGVRATILPGVEIGDGAIIGAGAVVIEDVGPYEIVGGVPAEKIGSRFEDKNIDRLMELEWWDWSESKIERNKAFFESDLDFSLIE